MGKRLSRCARCVECVEDQEDKMITGAVEAQKETVEEVATATPTSSDRTTILDADPVAEVRLHQRSLINRFIPHPSARFVLMGASGLYEPVILETIIGLTGKDKPTVLYIGTASYDAKKWRNFQVAPFADRGCSVIALSVTDSTPSAEEICQAFNQADIIMFSFGNTLFGVDRASRFGIKDYLQQAMERGVVLCGGSTGAICWFDGGHSNSSDPASYRHPSDTDARRERSWEYIRAPGFGLLPGIFCPHHDSSDSYGLQRALDFEAMLLRHPGETGICVDDWAALVINGERFCVVNVEGKPGSVMGNSVIGQDGSPRLSLKRLGRPGAWRKWVRSNIVICELVPRSGKVEDLLVPASEVVQDANLERLRSENPSDVP
mmetsp:Transcript_4400/g.7380  ORF Transcript_4400/g.7380 Transcript_4400/m.7380 type:complete len:377 (-) Transcript_4400:35-1165(-)